MKFLKKIFNKKSRVATNDGIFYSELGKILDFPMKNKAFYRLAFTHRSSNLTDERRNPINNERLEFLGDAILSSVIAAYLYKSSPAGDEGYLTKMRSKMVSRASLNAVAKELNFQSLIFSKGALHASDNMLGNVLEALVGAIFLDKGFQYCEKFIHKHILSKVEALEVLEQKIISYKSWFIEYCQKYKHSFKFETFEEQNNETQKYFSVRLYLNDVVIVKARATSKKKAEEKAAQRAYYQFQNKKDDIK